MVDSLQSPKRPDVVAVESAPRPTPTPARIPFKEILAKTGIRAAEAAMTVLPGSPLIATALRGGAGAPSIAPMSFAVSGSSPLAPSGVTTAAEGPGAGGLAGANGAPIDPQSALSDAQSNEMQMLVLQQQVAAQQNSFTVLSNILKSENDTERTAINNIK